MTGVQTCALPIYARTMRNEAKIVLKSGQDPNLVKQNIFINKQVDQLNTFKAVAEEWLLMKEKEWKQNNFQDVKRAIDNYLYPDLGHRPLSEITSAELLLVLKKIEGQGKYEATRRARQKCEAIFRYANLSQRCENNPASNLKGALASPTKKKSKISQTISRSDSISQKISRFESSKIKFEFEFESNSNSNSNRVRIESIRIESIRVKRKI